MAVTHARAAMQMAYIAKTAAAWAADLLTLPEQAGEPWPKEQAERFVADIQGKLAILSTPDALKGDAK